MTETNSTFSSSMAISLRLALAKGMGGILNGVLDTLREIEIDNEEKRVILEGLRDSISYRVDESIDELSRSNKKIMHDSPVTITAEEYEKLRDKEEFLDCLEACGVDNWDGYGEAYEMMTEEECD